MFAGALVKKRQYWPKGVPGALIDEHFENMEAGDIDMVMAATEEGKPFKIVCF